MKGLLFGSALLGAGAVAYSGWGVYQFYDAEFANQDDWKPFLSKLKPGLVVGAPTNTNRSINVNGGPLDQMQVVHGEIRKEWHWDKPYPLTLHAKKRNYEKEWQVELK